MTNTHSRTRKPRRRLSLTRAFRHALNAFAARRTALYEDLRKLGLDSVKAGFAAIILNIWLRQSALVYAGITAVILGLVAWGIGLPVDGEDDSHE